MIPDDARPLLGTAPDRVVAHVLGVTVARVYRWRTSLDIPAWGRVNTYSRGGGRPGITCPDMVYDLLGTLSDRVFAAHVGVSCTTARKWRIAAGRPPYRKHATPRGKGFVEFHARNRVGPVPSPSPTEIA